VDLATQEDHVSMPRMAAPPIEMAEKLQLRIGIELF